MGDGARRHPLHALVRADDRLHGREARLVPDAGRRGADDRRVLAAGTCSRASRTRRRSRRGGIRATFEARGYTAWDVTSPIFLQVEPNGVTLTIPTAYVSFTGEALDHKIPLLRSQDALGKQALRVLRWFGNTTATRVFTNIGPEQEYFLVDRRLAEQRPDLAADRPDAVRRAVAEGPGARGPVLRLDPRADPRVHDGSRPRAVAPRHPGQDAPQRGRAGQFEMAPVYEPTSVGSDHNMVVMATMRRLAHQHGLMLLIHEKPFAGINGSGKHNNWSMATDEGENLLDPGNDPHANAQFLAFLLAVIRGVNVHADLLRASIADAGQDHRLGANEAPPAIMSIFLGSQLEDVIEQIEQGRRVGVEEGRLARPRASRRCRSSPKDATDRNRTSPFAFTGNKFEFRAVGSSAPDLLAADRAQHGRRRLARPARRRARQAQAGRLRRARPRSCRASRGTTSRSSSRATATPRSGTPRRRDAACPTTGPPSTPCPL